MQIRPTGRRRRPEILKAIFHQLSDALFLYDKDLYIVGVNRAAQRLFGMSSEEMIGRPCRELFRCAACEPGCGVLPADRDSKSSYR